MRLTRLLFPAAALAVLCGPVLRAADTPPADPGFSVAKMDRSVAPGEDFAKFAAGGWYAATKIPADKSRWGGFDELAERNWSHVRTIVEAAAANPGAVGSLSQKVGDFYASAIDTAKRDQRGIQPIQPMLDRIAAVKDRDDLARVAAEMHVAIGNPLLYAGTTADQKQSDTYAFHLFQGGTSLPSKEYYFSERFARERWEFVGHVARMFELAGDTKALAHQRAEIVFNLEKALAENAKLPVELREREANYHKMTVEAAAAAYPGFPLRTFMGGLGLPAGVTEVIVGQPKFMEGLSRLLQERSLEEWKVYTRWQLLRSAGSYLSTAFEDERFRFSGTVLNGTPQQEPRWQRAARVLDGSIGEAVGQLYVEKHFPPAAKARMKEMIGNIQAVMRDRLQGLEWMSEATRAKAVAKFDRFEAMIGYTDQWRDYSAVEIRRDDFFGNVLRAAIANSRYQLDRTGGKVDKREWGMTPQTVNAYFSPTTNQIVFPAGILQPPFFDPSLDDAVNYGAIGCVIGHEITHGYDDQGRKSDANGNLVDWWTADDAAKFRERAQRVVAQFNSYQALPGLAVNGQLALGENIADLGGVSIAFEALQRSLRGKPAPAKIDGFTAEQRFFISWAQQWRTAYREDAMRLQVARGPHAPGNFRAIGPLVNFGPFFEAFGIKEGDKLWKAPADRAKIW